MKKLKKVVELFNIDSSTINNEIIENAAYVLTEMVSKSSTLHNKTTLESYLLSKEFLDVLFNNIFRHKILTTHLVPVVNAIILNIWNVNFTFFFLVCIFNRTPFNNKARERRI